MYNTKGSRLQTTVGQAKGIQAYRKVEFVLTQDFHLTSSAPLFRCGPAGDDALGAG